MVVPCQRCKWRDEQDYRELDDREKHFLMFMFGDFQHHMIIPEEYVRCLKGEIPGEIKLETRNGCSYTIGVSKIQENLVLTVGWRQFVENFDLQMGDSLILRYNGNSRFNVIIFDKLGREKALSVVADPFLHSEKEMYTETTETVNRSSGHQPMQMRSPTETVDRLHVHHQPQMQSPAETVNHSHGHPQAIQMKSRTETLKRSHIHPQHAQMEPSSKTLNSLPDQSPPTKRQRRLPRTKLGQVNRTMLISSSFVSSDDSFSSEEGHGEYTVPGYNYLVGEKARLSSVQKEQLDNGYITSRRTKLTLVQEEQVKEKVQSIYKDIPIFVAMMCKVNVVSAFILNVPNYYALKYLGDEQSVLLRRHDETWTVRVCGRNHALLKDRRFDSGWQKFVEDNNLKMGDICLFERLSNQRCTLKVHIVHLNDGS